MILFPAIMIGGPPDSGKSVLTYHLSQQLRQQGIQHYVLRAQPDGEGDWANESEPEVVRTILVSRAWSRPFVEHICQGLARRHLPLLVDVGGRPTEWQEAIFDHCTDAILLTPDAGHRAEWQARAARHHLRLLADLQSVLVGQHQIIASEPHLSGIISGLAWGQPFGGATFEALLAVVARLFACDPAQLRQSHLLAAPVEHALDLDRLARTLDITGAGPQTVWAPGDLPALLRYLPPGKPLGLYGRAPNWLYAAAALHTYPAPFYQFDVRLGWVSPPHLRLGLPEAAAPLQCIQGRLGQGVELSFSLSQAYLDYFDSEGLVIPFPPANEPLSLNGKLPHWLITALALAYRDAPLLAVYQPQAGRVVVRSRLEGVGAGEVL